MRAVKRGFLVLGLVVFMGTLGVLGGQQAQAAWPKKPITMFIPFAAGGSMDASVRALAPGMEKVLGKPIVLINKTGGTGTVALGVLAGAKPDGYTLSAGTSSGIFRIPVLRKVPYKPLASFTFLYSYAAVASGTVVKADSPWKTWDDFIEYAKKNPGKVKYSTTGSGSPMHVAMEIAAEKHGIKWTHIPYKGTMPSLTAVLGGHVDACSAGPKFVSMVQSGQMRVLVVHTKDRMAEFPDVPTLLEVGIPYYNDTVFGLFGPAGLDPAIVKKIEDAAEYAVDTPLFKDMAKKFAIVPLKMRGREFSKLLEEGWPKQVEIFRKLGRIKEPATQPR
ncbi:MAG: tripartite tricarboxylate transporter substrate binding protein [Deltaproteobacteria bacterium]|nr:tripartite tricarboxylate transporter substrate binding protein [Deltaproteobacteria bacterium]